MRAYRDISESSNLDFGVSYARGHNASGVEDGIDVGRFTTGLYGIDATFSWKPLRRAIYNSFLGRSEVVWSRREQPDGVQEALGFYVSGDYQFARRWTAGARYDRSDRADAASLRDSGQSLLLTYKPTEFSLVRGQYRRTQICRRRDRERVPLPVPVRDWRARRAPVLRKVTMKIKLIAAFLIARC